LESVFFISVVHFLRVIMVCGGSNQRKCGSILTSWLVGDLSVTFEF